MLFYLSLAAILLAATIAIATLLVEFMAARRTREPDHECIVLYSKRLDSHERRAVHDRHLQGRDPSYPLVPGLPGRN